VLSNDILNHIVNVDTSEHVNTFFAERENGKCSTIIEPFDGYQIIIHLNFLFLLFRFMERTRLALDAISPIACVRTEILFIRNKSC
jgi:hypothetical protein